MRPLAHYVITAIALAMAPTAHAQSWPTKPLTIYHGYLAGSNPDIVARAMQPALAERLGQPVVVEPKPGAAGRIGTAFVARQPADGYSAVMLTGGDAVLAAIARDLPYDLARDFEPSRRRWGCAAGRRDLRGRGVFR